MLRITIIFAIVCLGIFGNSQNADAQEHIPEWVKNIFIWYAEAQITEDELIGALQYLINEGIIIVELPTTQDCSGDATCILGIVTDIIDGDTIKVLGKSIRFALVNTPEKEEAGFDEARDFIESICPVGSSVLVDEDDMQTKGSYDRMIAVIYCNGENLSEAVLDAGLAEILTDFCNKSEFANDEWAQKHGC